MRVLVFTDSRGELKKAFPDQPIFTERLDAWAAAHGHVVEQMLCPFKWTTTLDFIECIERGLIDPGEYDRAVLYSGVVEWSPRNESNVDEVLAGSGEPIDAKRLFLRGRRRRMANDKRSFFREFFGNDAFDQHAARRYDAQYRGELTASLISIDWLRDRVLRYLRDRIGQKRLIVINANRIVPGWDGNYRAVNPDGRPANIDIINDYAAVVRESLCPAIDLSTWSDDDIRRYTVDNMHLSAAGSDWIFEKLLKQLA